MNILFLDSIGEKVYGGLEEWIRLVSHGLAERGHNLTIVGRSNSDFLKRMQPPVDKRQTIGLHISGDFNPGTIFDLKNIIQKNEIDVLIGNFNKDLRLGGLAAKMARNKPAVVWRVGLNLTKNNFVHRKLTPWLIDAVITPSESLKKQITAFGYIKENICNAIHTGIPEVDIDTDSLRKEVRNRYNISDNQVVAVTSGRFVNQKGHTYLIEAAEAIVREFPDIRFLWLGDGPLEGQFKEKIERLGLSENFIFAGMLKNVAEVLAAADLMVHPSVEEPFGIAVLEGMRAGLPVIASRVGGIPEVVDEGTTAVLLPPRKPAEIVRAVLPMLNDREKMKSFGANGFKRWHDKFRFDYMLDRIEDLFNRVSGKS